jgi:hypothetical protein
MVVDAGSRSGGSSSFIVANSSALLSMVTKPKRKTKEPQKNPCPGCDELYDMSKTTA